MLARRLRAAILELSKKGVGTRRIARTLKVSRGAVKEVTVRALTRPLVLKDHREEILELQERCNGNLVRVHEELTDSGVELSYPALTAFVL